MEKVPKLPFIKQFTTEELIERYEMPTREMSKMEFRKDGTFIKATEETQESFSAFVHEKSRNTFKSFESHNKLRSPIEMDKESSSTPSSKLDISTFKKHSTLKYDNHQIPRNQNFTPRNLRKTMEERGNKVRRVNTPKLCLNLKGISVDMKEIMTGCKKDSNVFGYSPYDTGAVYSDFAS
mmetsp:Transcript_684/g.570  ORF Transcript_684/g.570 Transcript_684/m.570 type:complete len:180 (+) Transcript_684:98-637(+)